MSDDERTRALELGRDAFNRKDYFAAHEHWEDAWRLAVDTERRWLQGLIQIAAALHHVVRGRTVAAKGLLDRACTKLADAPDRLEGIDVAAARSIATDTLEAIRLGEATLPATMRTI